MRERIYVDHFVAGDKIKTVHYSYCETVLELLDQAFVCRANSTDQDGINNIPVEGRVGPIITPGLWFQITDATDIHQLIGRPTVEMWLFITRKLPEIRAFAPSPASDQVG